MWIEAAINMGNTPVLPFELTPRGLLLVPDGYFQYLAELEYSISLSGKRLTHLNASVVSALLMRSWAASSSPENFISIRLLVGEVAYLLP